MHLLLQHLAPPDAITDRLWLQERLSTDEAEFESLWSDARAILAAAEVRRFFDPSQYVSARNEVAYVDSAGEVRRIDRVVELEDAIWVLDYKTGERGESLELPRVVARYRAQLEAYRKAVEAVSVGKPVRAALILGNGRFAPV
jgi:ATP-dependent helicase/nuclease subunit A